MKKIIYITLNLCIGLGLLLASCSEEEYSAPVNEIVDLTFSAGKGSITLNWGYAGDTEVDKNRCVEVRYYDLAAQKDVLKTLNGLATSFTLENTRQEHGEYHFSLQPFSMTFVPGAVQTISGVSGDPDTTPDPDPEVPEVESWEELVITEADINIWNDAVENKISPDTYRKLLLDGNLNTDGNQQVRPWGSALATEVFSIHVTYPTAQRYLKFSIANAGWSNDIRVISELECYVKAEETDEWTKIATLTAKDGLSQAGKTWSELKEILAPFEFKYIRLRASKTTAIGSPAYKAGFGITEFKAFGAIYKTAE